MKRRERNKGFGEAESKRDTSLEGEGKDQHQLGVESEPGAAQGISIQKVKLVQEYTLEKDCTDTVDKNETIDPNWAYEL